MFKSTYSDNIDTTKQRMPKKNAGQKDHKDKPLTILNQTNQTSTVQKRTVNTRHFFLVFFLKDKQYVVHTLWTH